MVRPQNGERITDPTRLKCSQECEGSEQQRETPQSLRAEEPGSNEADREIRQRGNALGRQAGRETRRGWPVLSTRLTIAWTRLDHGMAA